MLIKVSDQLDTGFWDLGRDDSFAAIFCISSKGKNENKSCLIELKF